MKNIDFYKNKTTETMMQCFAASGYESLDEFLAAEHVWKPKYAAGDIVRLSARTCAKTILNIDYERERYVCEETGYLTGTLLPVFIGGGMLDYDSLRYSFDYIPESDIEEKLGRLECRAFLYKIADIEAQSRP